MSPERVTAQFEEIDAEMAAEALANYAEQARAAARRMADLGLAAEAEITETEAEALERASDALLAALARHRSA